MKIDRRMFALIVLCVGGCATSDPAPSDSVSAVTIMTFNVENLFDTQHDADKDDYTFLPLAEKQTAEHQARCARIEVRTWREQCLNFDWTDAVLTRKLNALAASILANGDAGRGPDILVLQEVENRAVLERLRREHLAAAGYGPVVLLEGDDLRGIDVAFLSRLPVRGEPVLYPTRFARIDEKTRRDTRGILEATFELPDGSLLTGFAVHFPAPFHPAQLRVESYAFLAERLRSLPADRLAFAAGDFNTISAERWIIDQHVAADWVLPHEGCDDCRGTYYYARNDEWSFLDMILVNRVVGADGSSWAVEPDSATVATAWPQQTSPDGTPLRFDPVRGTGVSDHWPLKIRLRRAP